MVDGMYALGVPQNPHAAFAAMGKERRDCHALHQRDEISNNVVTNRRVFVNDVAFSEAFRIGMAMAANTVMTARYGAYETTVDDVLCLEEAVRGVIRTVFGTRNCATREAEGEAFVSRKHFCERVEHAVGDLVESERLGSPVDPSGLAHAQTVCTSAASTGGRATMEDCYLACRDISRLYRTNQYYTNEVFIAVLDGHLGPECAQFVADRIVPTLVANQQFDSNPAGAIRETLSTLDAAFMGNVASDESLRGSNAGTCVVVTYLRDDVVYIGNVGDCQALVARNLVQPSLAHCTDEVSFCVLNTAHSPAVESEAAGVAERGGVIMYRNGQPRVNGMLAVTRALGSRAARGPVSSQPDVSSLSLRSLVSRQGVDAQEGEPSAGSKPGWEVAGKVAQSPASVRFTFVVCSDGLTRVFNQKDLARTVVEAVDATVCAPTMDEADDEEPLTIADVPQALVDDGLDRGSTDNIAVVLLTVLVNLNEK